MNKAPVLCALAASMLFGQGDDGGKFNAKVLQNRYSLSVRNGQFSGTGAQVLRSAIAQSRFVLAGEEHGLAETPQFWTGVCNVAGPEGFHTMAIEEGPLVAAELERQIRQPGGPALLAEFDKQYPGSTNIFNSREEFEMLRRCAASAPGGRFPLWGLNQENLGAAGMILNRILDTRPRGDGSAAIRQLLQKSDDASVKFLQTGRISDLFMLSADDKELAAVAALLQKDGTPQARSLFASLVQSHEINKAWPADAERRFRLMKTLFIADYEDAARTGAAPPKVLLKFGSYHLYRGLNPMGQSGLGNYVAEFADGHGAQSLHICLMAVKGAQPLFTRPGQPARVRNFNLHDDPRSRYLQPMLDNLLESDWTMFDLRPLRQGLLGVHSDLATLVFGMDILVMFPDTTPSTPIRVP